MMLSLISDFRKTLKLVEVEELLDLYVYRPPAFLIVKAIAWSPITPNQLTLLSMAVGVAGGLCYGLGTRRAVILGAIFYAFSIVLDCADGQLARLKKSGTRMGRILDGLIDYVVTIAVYLGVALGLGPGPRGLAVWWLLMVAAAVSHIFHSAIFDYFRTRYLDLALRVPRGQDAEFREFQDEYDALAGRPGHRLRKRFIAIYLKYLAFQNRMTHCRNKSRPFPKVDREVFIRKNKPMIRAWSFLGSTTLGSLMIVATLCGRIEIYFWGRIVAANVLAAILYILQGRIDRRLGIRRGS